MLLVVRTKAEEGRKMRLTGRLHHPDTANASVASLLAPWRNKCGAVACSFKALVCELKSASQGRLCGSRQMAADKRAFWLCTGA